MQTKKAQLQNLFRKVKVQKKALKFYLPEKIQCLIFSFMSTQDIVTKVGQLSLKTRAMLMTSPHAECVYNRRIIWLKRFNPQKMQFLLSLLEKVYIMPQEELHEEVPSPMLKPIPPRTVMNTSLKEMKVYGADYIDFSSIIFLSLERLACVNSSTVNLNS